MEHAGTPVKTTDAGTVTEWEHFDYGYHSGTETDCNFPTLISIVKVFFIENHGCNLPAFLATPSLASDEDIKEIQKDFRVRHFL